MAEKEENNIIKCGEESPAKDEILALIDFIKPAEVETSKNELRAWYCYDWANSVYSSVGLVLFLPLLIYELAFKHQDADGFVYFGSLAMRPVSVSSSFMSMSLAFQSIIFISFGALADFGNFRKKMLIITSILGSICTMLFIFISDKWYLAGILTIFSNVFFGSSLVFYNSFLPILVESHPRLQTLIKHRTISKNEFEIEYENLSNHISSIGFIWGYISGVLLTLTSVLIVVVTPDDDKTLSPRLCIFLAGLWWLLFSIFTFYYLKDRSGPCLPDNQNYFIFSWKRLYHTLKTSLKLKNTMLYLFAYFIMSDGYNTISYIGILFGRDEMGMDNMLLVLIALETPFCALIGNYFYKYLHSSKNISSKNIVFINLICFSFLPIYGCIGFIPYSPIGLKQIWELFVFSFIYGFNLGSIQSFSRVLFSSLIPTGHESEMFSLYEITDKGASFIGPLIVTGFYQAFNSMRIALIPILLLLVIPIIILYFVDVKQGQIDAKIFATEISLTKIKNDRNDSDINNGTHLLVDET